MTGYIPPIKNLKGKVFLPASKSYSLRAFIVAACGGRSHIIHPSDCDDSIVASKVAKALGAKVKRLPDNQWMVEANLVKKLPAEINVGESGTALRLVLPLAALRDNSTVITGEGTLKGRPNKFLIDTIKSMGSNIKGSGSNDSIPIRISGGQLSGGKITIDGSISSQFISALLLTLPQLSADSILMLKGKQVSFDYITMTLLVLEKAGIQVEAVTKRKFKVSGNQRFKGLKRFTVPSDDGLAAFLLAAAMMVESDVRLTGHFNEKLIQADGQIYSLLERMGVAFKKTSRSIQIKGAQNISGGRYSLKDCPDLLPILCVLALFGDRETCFYDIGHARVKESDRISDLRKELLKIGADIRETADKIYIKPVKQYRSDVTLDPHHDHRLAMAFCVLGLKIGVTVKDTECINKSYPGFLKDFKSIGGKVLSKK